MSRLAVAVAVASDVVVFQGVVRFSLLRLSLSYSVLCFGDDCGGLPRKFLISPTDTIATLVVRLHQYWLIQL